MNVPAWLFTLGLWFAVACAGGGAGYLLWALVKDWRSGDTW
jgi:hypothetical protein